MSELTKDIGMKIKIFRKKKRWTVQDLADTICKSKATVSKYENGQISIDICTLYDIAQALDVSVDQLLYHDPIPLSSEISGIVPSFFKNTSHFYMYHYDGRNNKTTLSVIDVLQKEGGNSYKTMLYMNCNDFATYQNCENTYQGHMKHFDTLTNLTLQNQDTPTEQYIINILASFLDAPYKWALGCGISSRPLMPIAIKLLITKKPAVITADFVKALQVSKKDIRLLKHYNMFTVTGG